MKTKNWDPVQHHEIMDLVMEEFANRQWHLTKQTTTKANFDQDLSASFLFDHMETIKQIPNFDFFLGLTTSTNKHKRIKLYGGLSIDRICVVTKTILPSRIKTRGRFEEEIRRGLDVFLGHVKYDANDIVRYLMNYRLSPTSFEYKNIILNLGRKKILPWSRVGVVDAVYQKMNVQALWELLICVSCQIQKAPAIKQLPQLATAALLIAPKLEQIKVEWSGNP